jgi:alpha-L-fucosidase 2
VKIDLCTYNTEDIPTDERLLEFNSGKSDRGLWSLLFNYGRYLTIAGSRDGSEAMNLQGIWNDSLTPRWSSNYTVNINTQMNYYPTLMIDLPEMTKPLIKLIREISITGKETARELYHAEGFVCHHNTDLWRHTTPIPGKALWSFWNMASGWLCRHLYDYYVYTLDTEFLSNTAYPIMKKAAAFYLDMLTDDGNGSLIISPSTSPENGFITERGPCGVSKTATLSMSIIKELFGNVEKCAEILSISDDVTNRIKTVTPHLLPFKTGRNGALLEWYDEEKEVDVHHIHISHLYALHPAKLITDDTPLLQEAARKTLKKRGDEGTGWSFSWKINFWARLKDGNHALRLINMQLRPAWVRSSGGGTYQNMFNAHPPFQIDGNFGATSGICEMLLQSDEKTIELLPALPDEWRDGRIEGIRAMNNIKASIEWKNGALVHYKLTGDTENVTVKYKNRVLQ